MIYLIIAIVCASLFSIMLKISQENNINSQQVIFFNYVFGLVISLIPIGGHIVSGQVAAASYWLPAVSMLLVLVQGAFFAGGFNLMDQSVWRSGVALTTASAKTSLIVPVILSWLLFGQSRPSWFLVALILAAMLLMILPNRAQYHDESQRRSATDAIRQRKAAVYLAVVFVVYGCSDFMLKVVQQSISSASASPDDVACRLSSLTPGIFLASALFSGLICLAKGSFRQQKVSRKSLLAGLVLGLANYFATDCSFRALASMSTSLFYPLYNVGIVAIATLVGIGFFKEKIRWPQVLGLVLAAVAIALAR